MKQFTPKNGTSCTFTAKQLRENMGECEKRWKEADSTCDITICDITMFRKNVDEFLAHLDKKQVKKPQSTQMGSLFIYE